MVTRPVGRLTVTLCTPSSWLTLETTAFSQWAHVMPRTWKVVVPTNVRGVVFIIGFSLSPWPGCAC
jgi:hypothetical protein